MSIYVDSIVSSAHFITCTYDIIVKYHMTYMSALLSTYDAILILDKNKTYQWCNACMLYIEDWEQTEGNIFISVLLTSLESYISNFSIISMTHLIKLLIQIKKMIGW